MRSGKTRLLVRLTNAYSRLAESVIVKPTNTSFYVASVQIMHQQGSMPCACCRRLGIAILSPC